MVVVGVALLWTIVGLVGVGGYQLYTRRQITFDRFTEATEEWSQREVGSESRSTEQSLNPVSSTRRLARRWIWVPWTIGILMALTVWIVFRWSLQ